MKQLRFLNEVPQSPTAVLEEIEYAATKSPLKLCAVASPIRRLLARVWVFTRVMREADFIL